MEERSARKEMRKRQRKERCKVLKGTERDESKKKGLGEDRDGGERQGDNEGERRWRTIVRISEPLWDASEALKCTPIISILTPPLSSGLFLAHYHQAWSTRCRKHKPTSFPIIFLPKCHSSHETRTQNK